MATVLDTRILSKLDTDVRANELFHHSKCLKDYQYQYEIWLNKTQDNNTEMAFEKAVALESTIAYLKQKAYEQLEYPIEVRLILKMYNKYLT